MKKPLTFNDYKLLQKLSFNQMNVWATSMYKSGYEDAKEDFKNEEEVAIITTAELEEFLVNEGFTKKQREKIFNKIFEERN